MGDPNRAGKVDPAPESENQEKIMNIFMGVFFDVREDDSWYNAPGNYLNKGKKWKEDAESDFQDSKAGRIAQCVEGTARNVVEKLPPNPVSKAIKTGLDAKDKVVGYKDKLEGAVDKIEGTIGGVSDKLLDNKYVPVEGVDPVGSKRSIISMMEPAYYRMAEGEYGLFDIFSYRFYAQGSLCRKSLSINAGVSTEQKSKNEDDESDFNKDIPENVSIVWSNDAVNEVFGEIQNVLASKAGQKLSVAVDIFGYENDASIDILKPKIDSLKQTCPNIAELKVEYVGKYKKINDPDEVEKDLKKAGGQRFRNEKFLKK